MYAAYLLAGLGITHHKVAETEVVDDGFAEVDGKFFGVFVNECAPHLYDIVGILGLGALDDQGQIGVARPQLAGQFYAGFGVLDAFAHERNVADDAEDVFGILVVDFESFLVVACEHYLGTSAHTQHALVLVECFGREETRLRENEFVDYREHRAVESHRVLDDDDELHAHIVNVIVGIEFVLEQLDDGEQQVDVAKP